MVCKYSWNILNIWGKEPFIIFWVKLWWLANQLKSCGFCFAFHLYVGERERERERVMVQILLFTFVISLFSGLTVNFLIFIFGFIGFKSLMLLTFIDFYYFWVTERDRARAGEGQGERETQNPKQAPGSEPSAQSPTWGSNPRTRRS